MPVGSCCCATHQRFSFVISHLLSAISCLYHGLLSASLTLPNIRDPTTARPRRDKKHCFYYLQGNTTIRNELNRQSRCNHRYSIYICGRNLTHTNLLIHALHGPFKYPASRYKSVSHGCCATTSRVQGQIKSSQTHT
jgi:hypothetical protein